MIKNFFKTIVEMKKDIDEYYKLRIRYRGELFWIYDYCSYMNDQYSAIIRFCTTNGYPVPRYEDYSIDQKKLRDTLLLWEEIEEKFPEQKNTMLRFLSKSASWSRIKKIHNFLQDNAESLRTGKPVDTKGVI